MRTLSWEFRSRGLIKAGPKWMDYSIPYAGLSLSKRRKGQTNWIIAAWAPRRWYNHCRGWFSGPRTLVPFQRTRDLSLYSPSISFATDFLGINAGETRGSEHPE